MALALQQIRKLGGSGGFTRALQADEHNHVGNAARKHEPRIGLAEQRRELVEHDFTTFCAGVSESSTPRQSGSAPSHWR